MADVINLVPNVAKIGANGGKYLMTLDQAVDVSAWDKLDLQINVLSGEIASLTVMTAMQNDTEEGWVTAASTTSVAVGYENLTVPSGEGNVLLRYVRLSASTASPTSDAALFTLRGMARSNG